MNAIGFIKAKLLLILVQRGIDILYHELLFSVCLTNKANCKIIIIHFTFASQPTPALRKRILFI